MSTYRLTLEYDGWGFHGWQSQTTGRTVEGVLRDAIIAATRETPRLTAAGRTDSGAHAHGQVVGVTLERAWVPGRLKAAVNAHLPEDAVVVDAAAAPAGFHARHDAVRRTYRYLVIARDQRSAVARHHAWTVRGPLDIEAMRAATQHLIGTHDFAAFGRSPWDGGTTVRTVHGVSVDHVALRADDVTRIDTVSITVTADAFLRGMMRAFAGALVAVGQQRMDAAGLGALLAQAEPAPRQTIAPAHGLHQWSVTYAKDTAGACAA